MRGCVIDARDVVGGGMGLLWLRGFFFWFLTSWDFCWVGVFVRRPSVVLNLLGYAVLIVSSKQSAVKKSN